MRPSVLPVSFRAAIALFIFSVPLLGIEVAIQSEAPYWRLPQREIGTWLVLGCAVFLPLAFGMIRGKNWVWSLSAALHGIWILATTVFALRMKMTTLGYFATIQAFYSGTSLIWLRREMKRSFFDPRLHWYQGLPKPVPGLACRLQGGGRSVETRVSRIDQDGVFVFSDEESGFQQEVLEFLKAGHPELVFVFRDREVRCKGRAIRILADGRGAGFQFWGMVPDALKELGDFVENLRGEGYVE